MVLRCKLANILLEQDRSQKWLAEATGISMTTISQIKKGKRLPTLEVAFKIAKALNVTIEQLWMEE